MAKEITQSGQLQQLELPLTTPEVDKKLEGLNDGIYRVGRYASAGFRDDFLAGLSPDIPKNAAEITIALGRESLSNTMQTLKKLLEYPWRVVRQRKGESDLSVPFLESRTIFYQLDPSAFITNPDHALVLNAVAFHIADAQNQYPVPNEKGIWDCALTKIRKIPKIIRAEAIRESILQGYLTHHLENPPNRDSGKIRVTHRFTYEGDYLERLGKQSRGSYERDYRNRWISSYSR